MSEDDLLQVAGPGLLGNDSDPDQPLLRKFQFEARMIFSHPGLSVGDRLVGHYTVDPSAPALSHPELAAQYHMTKMPWEIAFPDRGYRFIGNGVNVSVNDAVAPAPGSDRYNVTLLNPLSVGASMPSGEPLNFAQLLFQDSTATGADLIHDNLIQATTVNVELGQILQGRFRFEDNTQPFFEISNFRGPLSVSAVNEDAGAVNHSITLPSGATVKVYSSGSFSYDPRGRFDHLPNLGESITEPVHKDTTDFLLGITQLFGPSTVVRFNLTLGYSEGYVTDPYKRVLFTDFPYFPGNPYTVWPEARPSHRFRQVGYFSLQQHIESLHGAVEGSYRLHHDDWGLVAHSLQVQWHQKITKYVILSPLFRYYTQNAADFYAPSFPGDPSLPPDFEPQPASIPAHYSADYRLSAFDSYTYGAALSIRAHEHVSLDFAYKRYEMLGTDHATSKDQYPKAHVWTAGLTLWF